MASPLLGPPSLCDASASATTGNGNNDDDDEGLMMGLTENNSATFLNTGNPCLDFFFKVVPDTPSDSLIESLQKAWTFNPLMTLKLICNLRGVRGTGKSDKEGFYTAALWLHRSHPKTLAGNVEAIADFGYFKDFLEILYRILECPSVRQDQKAEYLSQKGKRRSKILERRSKKLAKKLSKKTPKALRKEKEEALRREKRAKEEALRRKIEEAVRKEKERIRKRSLKDAIKSSTVLIRNAFEMLSVDVEDQEVFQSPPPRPRPRSSMDVEDQEVFQSPPPRPPPRSSMDVEDQEVFQTPPSRAPCLQQESQTPPPPPPPPLDPESTTPKYTTQKEEARALRKEKERNKAKKALMMYNGDADYRRLYDSVASLFGELLKADAEKLNSGKLKEISLAAKWCPTIDSSFDKATLICESIARKVFPREKYPEYEGLEDRHYVYRVRDRLRKDILVPLHKALELPEVYMSAKKWDTLPYNRVPSVAMKKYQKLFTEHDKERFAEYLEKVKSGNATIAAGALLPHEIIGAVKKEEEREVAELQWKRLVDDMKQKGTLSNCIAVSDVSGSMEGIPMEVSVALGVLVSELSEEPWKGKLITFSTNPQIQEVKGDTLLEKTEFVRNMDWGGSTNFQGVFDRILEVAVKKKLKDEKMVKRIFVFSDMEFDEASGKNTSYYGSFYNRYQDIPQVPWETDYQVIERKYSEHGYSVPEIVFWNLRNSDSIPVYGKQSGVALVSGFSKNLLKIFMDGGEVGNPVVVMELALAGEEYQKLAVFD